MSVEHKIAKAVSEDYLALQEEIKALKAQVELLRETMEISAYQTGDGILLNDLEKTPAQCLADIRADAVIDYEASLSSFPMTTGEYAQQLRDNIK